jgi:hypothetical protein
LRVTGKLTGGLIVPTRLPDKPRAKSIRASDVRPDVTHRRDARVSSSVATFDWLALWALSIGFSAIVMAAMTYFSADDPIGASSILLGAATNMAVALGVSAASETRR